MPAPIFFQRLIPFIVSLAMFMEAVDATVLNTAIPTMSVDLGVNPIDLKIALISYLLSLALFIPISGWVADKYSTKRVFTIAVAIFTISSLGCGFAHNLSTLVIMRILQGLGGALTMPVGRLIVIRTFERHQIITVMSHIVMVASLGLVIGPVVGGFIVHNFSWPWIFWINIPVGLLTLVLAHFGLSDNVTQAVPPLDKIGFLLFGGSLAGLTFGLSMLSESNIRLSLSFTVMLVALLLLGVYWWHSRNQAHPIVKSELLRIRTFRVAVLGNLLSRIGFGGVPFLVPLLLQIGLGFSAQLSGLLLAPVAFGVLLLKPFTKHVLRMFGYKNLLIINTILVGLSLWSFIFINLNTSIYFIGTLTFIYGLLVSVQFSAMNSLGYAELGNTDISAATSIMSTLQQLSQSFGVAVSAVFLRYFSHLTPSHAITVSVLHYTFFATGILTMLSTIVFVKLHAQDGQQMIE